LGTCGLRLAINWGATAGFFIADPDITSTRTDCSVRIGSGDIRGNIPERQVGATAMDDAERQRLTLQLFERLRQDCDEAQSIGCGPQTRFRQMIARDPVKACRSVIMVAHPPPGFLCLYEHDKKSELSAEAAILKGPWRALSESAVLEKAKYWLIKYERPDLAV
jgi:hypothetical protein